MRDAECVGFLQWALPRLRMRWRGFRKVRRQVCRRVENRFRELDLPGFDQYRAYLEGDPAEWERLDELCHVTVSRFNRDRAVFDFLQRTVLPVLAHRAREHGAALEAWSAGCASGEEAHTLALLWHLALGRDFAGIDLRVLATDVDEVMLRRAHHAEYPQSSVRALPESWRQTAFVQRGSLYRLRRELLPGVTVRRHDLRHDRPDGPFHLVLCRNVAFTYFELDLQEVVATRLATCVRPGGALVLGAHETLPERVPAFVPWSESLRVYRRSTTNPCPSGPSSIRTT
jgi:chemotaxis protein methyltransferase CheR